MMGLYSNVHLVNFFMVKKGGVADYVIYKNAQGCRSGPGQILSLQPLNYRFMQKKIAFVPYVIGILGFYLTNVFH